MDDLLKIPSFLRRKHKKYASVKPVFTDPDKWVPNKKYWPFWSKPPQSSRFKGAEKIDLWLADEAPAIGSGYRTAWARVGRKWVYLCDQRGNRGTIKRSTYDARRKGSNE